MILLYRLVYSFCIRSDLLCLVTVSASTFYIHQEILYWFSTSSFSLVRFLPLIQNIHQKVHRTLQTIVNVLFDSPPGCCVLILLSILPELRQRSIASFSLRFPKNKVYIYWNPPTFLWISLTR